MLKVIHKALVLACLLTLAACGTTDSTLKNQGHGDAYVLGYHDGRHSGMKEAGSDWEHYIRDHERYEADDEYRKGWNDGEVEGKRLQVQAETIGNAAAGAYSGYEIGKEVDKSEAHPNKIAKDAMKGVDTGALNSLGK